jgi:hypothetical protein
MKKIIIHIGQAKTGTTTLQKYLSRNRGKLLRQGIIYPEANMGYSHGVLAIPFSNRVQRALVSRLGSDLDEARKLSVDHWREVISEAETDPHSILLLSSEHFGAAPDLKNLPNFIRGLSSFSGEIDFVYYVRTPSEKFTSSIQQYQKASHRIPRDKSPRLEYLEGLKRVANLRIRHFSRDSLINGDIVDDFCSLTNIYNRNFNPVKKEANTSISAEGMILLQEYRKLHHKESHNVFTPDTQSYLKAIIHEERKDPEKYTKPSLNECFAAKLDADSPLLKWLRNFYSIDLRKPHDVPPSEYRDTNEVTDVKELIRFDSSLVQELRKSVDDRLAALFTPPDGDKLSNTTAP